ncbi:MAG: SRPBCC family protein, partial [Planctomycetes bacterium]|nr:SRPBCC family protein [Planctomycetota bacterium]
MTATLVLTVDVDAPVERTWAGATDWAGQGEWMLGTTVRPTHQQGIGVGAGIEAFTGVGPFGFLDTMEITLWEPPHRCHVLHTGRLVKG